MTAMNMHSPAPLLAVRARQGVWRNGLAAGLAVAMHGVVVALLIAGWSPALPSREAPHVLHTQLVMLPAAPAPEPVAEPVPAPVAPTPPTPPQPQPVMPAKPRVDPQIQAQKLEKAALARKRVEDKAREQHQREQAQQREQQQQRLAEERARQEHLQQAQLAAERRRQQAAQAAQAAADIRQYRPLSKEAPDYPRRALDKNIEGDCSVEYTVNPQGRVENPKVLEGCHPLFVRPSLMAANTFRYKPRIVDGRAVAVPAVRNTFHYRIK